MHHISAKRQGASSSSLRGLALSALSALFWASAQAAAASRPDKDPGQFKDCADCPSMRALPAGNFVMGSPATESGRRPDEGPTRSVTLGYRLGVAVTAVTRGEYARFVAERGEPNGGACVTFEDGKWLQRAGRDWRAPGFVQTDREPVVCVSWNDAQAYAAWLRLKTGHAYRLLSEAEWEYAARAGSTTRRYWADRADGGDGADAASCEYANVHDVSSARVNALGWPSFACDDGHSHTATVGSFKANAFGLFDMLGNVWQWVEDCHRADYQGAPSDGSAVADAGCSRRVVRGGSWDDGPNSVRAARRDADPATARGSSFGFRLARTLL